jgi:predicted nucleic acid-binding protein
MKVLVDSSVWIDYFRSGEQTAKLDTLIDEDQVVTNDLILCELIPFMRMRHQAKLVERMRQLETLPMIVDWEELREFQYRCLKDGQQGIGLPDLIIAQNALQNRVAVYSLDLHFKSMSRTLKLKQFE